MRKNKLRLFVLGLVLALTIAAGWATGRYSEAIAGSKGDGFSGRESNLAGSKAEQYFGRESNLAGSQGNQYFGGKSS